MVIHYTHMFVVKLYQIGHLHVNVICVSFYWPLLSKNGYKVLKFCSCSDSTIVTITSGISRISCQMQNQMCFFISFS